MMSKIINKIIDKNNFKKTKLIIAFVISLSIAIVYTLFRKNFVIDKVIIITSMLMYVFLHFIIKLDKLYGFIYKYRVYIAGIAICISVLLEYSGSSIGVYNELLQGKTNEKYFQPIFGKYRSIRSDEWTVNTPAFISQAIDNQNRFGYFNDNLRGTATDMFSVIAPPVWDILILAKPFNIGFLLFGAAKGLSFLWAGKWIILMLVSFEFFMLILDKNKLLSLCGMILTVFSASTQWWNMTDFFLWGMLAIILADKYLRTTKLKVKLVCALGIFISALSYIFIMYPAWQVSFMYIYIAIFIALCIKNRKEYKFKKEDYLIVCIVAIGIIGLFWRYVSLSSDTLNIIMNTDYPGKRYETGKDGLKVLFSYVYSFLFPYIDIGNPCEFSGMMSFYPIPMIIAIIYLIRNKDNRKKHMAFLIPLLIVSTIFSIFILFGMNETCSKITLLYMVPGRRLAIPLGFLQILMLLYVMANCNNDSKILKEDFAKIISLILSVVILSVSMRAVAKFNIFGPIKSYCCGIILLVIIFLMFTMNKNKNKNCLIMFLIGLALFTGVNVNPIQKGISILTDKPIAKEVKKIVDENPDSNLWITDSTFFYIPDYLLASGAKVLNSTNIYPNFEMYRKILGEEKFNDKEVRKIYNRYAHVSIEITEKENNIELLFEDSIKLKVTPEKIDELGVNYIVSVREIEEFNTENVKFERLSNEQGVLLYKVKRGG